MYARLAFIKLFRTIITVAIDNGWSIDLLNVVCTFLHAKLPENDQDWIQLSILSSSSIQAQLVELVNLCTARKKPTNCDMCALPKPCAGIGPKQSRMADCSFIKDRPHLVYITLYMKHLLVEEEERAVEEAERGLGNLFEIKHSDPSSHILCT